MTPQSHRHMRPRRAGNERSRNGCMTCKIRRVKCDETRPYCRRCTETGRKCEGPVIRRIRFIRSQPAITSTIPTPQLEVSLLAPQHSEHERRAFRYFMRRAAPLFAGAVDASFWEKLVPQLAQTYSFVWDTVVCLSSLLEHVPYDLLTAITEPTGLTTVTNREHRQALKFYNRAISNARQLAEHAQIDESVIALSYILFASVEFQQRNVRTGTDLIKRCCNILTDNLTSLHLRQRSIDGQAVHQVVAPFVLRKAVVMATLGENLPPQWAANDKVSKLFKAVIPRYPTLNEARVQLHTLVFRCYDLIRVADFVPNTEDDDPGRDCFLSQRQLLLDKLMQWKTSFTATIEGTVDVERYAEVEWRSSYLLMYWAVCYISLAASISPHQTVFDHFMDHFIQIVKHASVYLRHGALPRTAQLQSSLDPGVIPPLYFCATKCRDPVLRREALHLMRQASRQESLWAFVVPDRVAAKVISIEEGDCGPSLSSNPQESQYVCLPPEERRIAYASVVGRQAPGGEQRQALELSRFDFAPDGSKVLINDYVWLDDAEAA
ncbi:hypothetical protein PV04_06351 [Phialophora macrospora]|uniref:Zn(2)-C6 fungal-type domain-containing protein n=1 Tax=Phialophora macrospora TaxID=1851006 RepID=A0A0D2DY70_9EURO|nr:hypothetical protein PV04_06351 [Phialophora macrospora]